MSSPRSSTAVSGRAAVALLYDVLGLIDLTHATTAEQALEVIVPKV
jgi:hypothetical protein